MGLRRWIIGAAICGLGCAQAIANPLADPHSAGPTPLQRIGTSDAAGVLSRLGFGGRPPIIWPLGTGAIDLQLSDPIPALSRTSADMVVVRRRTELWIERRP